MTNYRIFVPVILSIFLTKYPAQLGFYELLFSFDWGFGQDQVGLFPLTTNEKYWRYTFSDLYGDGGVSDASYKNRLWNQTALVTGANSGLGYEISLALARLGVRVTMACRNPEKCAAAAAAIRSDTLVLERNKNDRNNAPAVVVTATVDVSSLASVQTFCHDFLASNSDGEGTPLPLDMLFLNAGIGYHRAQNDGSNTLSADGIEIIFATNVVGHHLMYKLLEPSIRRSDDLRTTPPRIVQSASCASYLTRYPYRVATDLETLNTADRPGGLNGLYSQSKLAQILWSRELTARLHSESSSSNGNENADQNPNSIVYVNSAHPGAVDTNIWWNPGVEDVLMARLFRLLCKLKLLWKPEEGALTLVYLGTAVEQLQTKNIRGQYFHPMAQRMDNHPLARDDDPETKLVQEKLWKFLDELVADFV